MVAGIGLVAGLAASRFLKASSERRYGSVHPPTGGQLLLLDAVPAGGAYQPATVVASSRAGERTMSTHERRLGSAAR